MPQQMDDEIIRLDPRSTVLVVVDMENDFCKAGGKVYQPEGVDEVIPKLERLLERCRRAAVQVIFVQSIRYPDSPEFVRFGLSPFILKDTWGSTYIEELAPRPGEPVVEKNTHDCFHETRMDALLGELNILPETHSVVVTGVAANVCVYHAVMGFHVRHYPTVVPIDCCAGRPAGRKMLEAQLLLRAYNYNVSLCRSDDIHF